MTAKQESNLLITSMITAWIGQHKVLLPINHNYSSITKLKKKVVIAFGCLIDE